MISVNENSVNINFKFLNRNVKIGNVIVVGGEVVQMCSIVEKIVSGTFKTVSQ